MATYKELHGQAVKDESSDPTATGEIFYNSSTNTFRSVVQTSAWFAQSPTTTQHGDGAGAGPTTACVIWTGYSPNSPPVTNATEEFNGNGWTAGGNYPVSGFMATGAAGTLTAALGMGGRLAPPAGANTNVTGEYDGTSWTTGNNTPDARYALAGFGSQTAAVGFGGNNRADAGPSNPDGSGTRADTFEYDGTNWTTGNNYPTSVSAAGSCGSQTAGLGAGGGDRTDGSGVNTSCTYDGTNWTAVSNINTARGAVRQSGNQTSALLFGPGTQTESWDGSSWTNAPSLAGGGYGGSSGHNNNPAGNTSALLAARRDGSSYPVATEEFAVATTVITPAAWASSGSMNVARDRLAGAGTQTAALGFGSEAPPGAGTAGNKSESYDGTSWTETPTIQTNRDSLAGAGTQTAALAFAGDSQVPPSGGAATTGATEEWNGSSWSEQNDMSTARRLLAGNGTQTAGLAVSGYAPPSNTTAVEEYDGSSWTNGGAVSVARRHLGAAGTQTAGLAFGGYATDDSNATEEYDGSSWTTGGVLNTARNGVYGMGLQTAALASGGSNPSYVTSTEAYDGTVWSTRPNMGTARAYGGSSISSPATAGLAFAGTTGSLTAVTEEFTGETTAVNVKTITTS